jgi:glycosyltransferase involved in cell wall biosynthesis
MNASPLLGVVIPTRNSIALLPRHLKALEGWLDLAGEVIVVDSQSSDGTLDCVRRELIHPRWRIVQHPPGLYQSWNYGIRQVSAKYVYIATVGDAITRAGIEHLMQVAEHFQSDVVISKPVFERVEGGLGEDVDWPIDDLIAHLRIRDPFALRPVETFYFALTNVQGALLGSAASNLFRTTCLQERPFPADFGTVGDGAWGLFNALGITLAVSPQRCSRFLYHEKTYNLRDYRVDRLNWKLFLTAQRVLREERRRTPQLEPELAKLRIDEVEKTVEQIVLAQERLEGCRQRSIPWIFQVQAWQARAARSRLKGHLARLKTEAAAYFLSTRR